MIQVHMRLKFEVARSPQNPVPNITPVTQSSHKATDE